MRVTEEDEERPTFHVGIGDFLAILVNEIERTTDRRSGCAGTSKVSACVKKYTGENNQSGDKCRKDQQNL